MRAGLLLFALVGCSFTVSPAGAGGTDDARTDADHPDARCASYSSQLDTCAHPTGTGLVLTGMPQLDTGAGTLISADGDPIMVTMMPVTTTTNMVEVMAVFVQDLTLAQGTQLRVTGPRPVAFVASGAVRLATTSYIDVGNGGAGARSTCAAGHGANDDGGAAGGGGGGFGAAGGPGGNGDSDGGQSVGGFAGAPITLPAGPLGGCPGGNGGTGDDPGGAGGPGGGAVYIVSANRIDLEANAGISAGGGGGGGGMRSGGTNGDAGGGGGGSGGMIFLEAPVIRSAGALAANGGGAGEGSGNGSPGRPGSRALFVLERALGGAGNSPTGTDGGRGGNSQIPVGESPPNVQAGGGGGGGGGVGFVRVISPDPQLGTIVTPMPIVEP